jgi:hypothetical protein
MLYTGTVDINKLRRDKKEEEKHEAEINSLHSQIEESERQTQEMKKQTHYLVIGLIITSVSSLASIIIQTSQDLFRYRIRLLYKKRGFGVGIQ